MPLLLLKRLKSQYSLSIGEIFHALSKNFELGLAPIQTHLLLTNSVSKYLPMAKRSIAKLLFVFYQLNKSLIYSHVQCL